MVAQDSHALLVETPTRGWSELRGWTGESDAPFHAVAHLGRERTWQVLCDRLAHVLVNVFEQRGSRKTITPARLLFWHSAIFGRFFSHRGGAGRFREDWERTTFGVYVECADGSLGETFVDGVSPDKIAPRLEAACAPFGEPPGSITTVDEACVAAANLLAEVVLVHPFIDGNLRVATVAMEAALHYHGVPAVPLGFGDVDFARGLSYALRPDRAQSTTPLAEALRERVDIVRRPAEVPAVPGGDAASGSRAAA
jgi:fido (protein-threonine AMPylation protein)